MKRTLVILGIVSILLLTFAVENAMAARCYSALDTLEKTKMITEGVSPDGSVTIIGVNLKFWLNLNSVQRLGLCYCVCEVYGTYKVFVNVGKISSKELIATFEWPDRLKDFSVLYE